jgi:hypothetical protein
MMTKLVALTAALVTASSVAHAQAPGETAPGSDVPELKNPDTALMLSLGGTAASVGMVLVGASSHDGGGLISAGVVSSLVTPSLGEWYAGKPLTAGMGIRAASAVVTMVGIAESLECLDFEGSDTSCHSDDSAGLLVAGGLIGYATGTIYDIATAPRAAREYNRAHAITVQPSVMRTPSGTTTMGVGIGGTF